MMPGRVLLALSILLAAQLGGSVAGKNDERLRMHAVRRKQGEALRRAKAQDQTSSIGSSALSDADKLLPFSVAQSTAMLYLSAVEGLLKDLLERQIRFTTLEEKDEAIAGHLARRAFVDGEFTHSQKGGNIMSGIVYVRPD